MGRRPKNAPKGAPLAISRLTLNQYLLMFEILVRTYAHPGDGKIRLQQEYPILWSPKALRGRPLTKNEAAATSRRLSNLVSHGLIEKQGRLVKVTRFGKIMMRAYALEHEDEPESGYVFRLGRMIIDRHETASNLEAIQKVMDIARIRGRSNLLTAGRGVLPDLFEGEIKKLNEFSREIDDELRTHGLRKQGQLFPES